MGSEFSKSCGQCVPTPGDTDGDDLDGHMIENLLSSKETAEDTVISNETGKSIACIHLIADTIRTYFECPENQCDQNKKKSKFNAEAILNNLMIIREAPRNYLLQIPIRNIEIAVNTRGLARVHREHLTKYHSKYDQQKKGSNCVLWDLYLNKFVDKQPSIHDMYLDDEGISNMKDYETIADCDYIMNAQFIALYILSKYVHSPMRNKLSVRRDPITKCYEIEVIDSIEYPSDDPYDLDGVRFTIFDVHMPFKEEFGIMNMVKSMHLETSANNENKNGNESDVRDDLSASDVHNRNREKLPDLKRNSHRMSDNNSFSAQLMVGCNAQNVPAPLTKSKSVDIFNFQTQNKRETIPIGVPNYKVKGKEINKCVAFTVNALQIKMSDFLDLNDDDSSEMNFDLVGVIENSMKSYNALQDFRSKKLTHPNPKKILQFCGAHLYFWDLISNAIVLRSWTVSESLIAVHKDNYHLWLIDKLFWNKNDKVTGIRNDKLFVDIMFSMHLCKSYRDYERMLNVMKLLEFIDKFKAILDKLSEFKSDFVEGIQNTIWMMV